MFVLEEISLILIHERGVWMESLEEFLKSLVLLYVGMVSNMEMRNVMMATLKMETGAVQLVLLKIDIVVVEDL